MSGGGSRVSVPNTVRKMIHNIKDLTGNDSEEEIYAMLKECSMDPNETAQKLLLQDTFHEVKRKRDKRKEVTQNLNKESAEPRWKPGMHGRGGRGGRVNFSPRHTSHEAGSGRNSASGKANGVKQIPEKAVDPPLATSQETKKKDASSGPSSIISVVNGPTGVASGGVSIVHATHSSAESNVCQPEVTSSLDVSKLGTALPSSDVNKICTIAFGTGDVHGLPIPCSSKCMEAKTPAPESTSAGCFSHSDPVLVPSNDSRPSGTMGAIKREVVTQQTPSGQNAIAVENKLTSASESSKSQGVGKNLLCETSQPSSTSTHGSSSVSRPSSNYSSRSQQITGLQKVGSNKEWKPKPTNPSVALASETAGLYEVPTIPVEVSTESQPVSNALDSEEVTPKPQKLEELHLPHRKHVILPNHIHVPEAERINLSFGSFGATFGVNTGNTSGPDSDMSSMPLSETSQGAEEAECEEDLSNENALATAEEGDFTDHSQSPTHGPENLSSGDVDVSADTVAEYNESKQDIAFLPGGQQYSVVHTSPNYNFGFVPPMLGSQVPLFENSESQARDVSRLPSFIVQQPFDPTSYYAQFYGAGADSDGRLSPFTSPGVTAKYNGSVTMLPPQSSQSPQEGGNSLVLSTAGPTALGTQATGLMQSSIAMTQQPVPIFRPPGMHIPHYPPNYIPYGPYFSHPFYVPPPAIHPFLSNGAFPHQPQASNLYPAPPAAATTGVKYSLPQYKPGTNTGNAAHIGMLSGYGTYGSSPASYNPSSASAAGNTTSNEDLGASQFKESNVYNNGQQSEGVAVWIAAPGRDSLPTSSFYNLPPQGQHVTYAPTQAAHGNFAGMYHPAQAVTAATVHPLLQQSQTMGGPVDMVGPTGNVYQQQHTPINWPSNY